MAEYRCGTGTGLGLELGWLELGLGSGLVFYFPAVLCNCSPFYALRIAQMQNGYCVKIRVSDSGEG